MSSRTRSLITTDRTILRIAARAVTTLSALAIVSVPSAASAQTVLHACYVPGSGTVYRIKATNTPQNCLQPTHIAFSWTDAAGMGGGGGSVSDHGALTGLGDDDHLDYLRSNVTRNSNGFGILGTTNTGTAPALTTVASNQGGFLFHADKGALRVGSYAMGLRDWSDARIGFNSFAFGWSTIASDENSVAFGQDATSTSANAVAIGKEAAATAQSGFAIGMGTQASGQFSAAFGQSSQATAMFSAAFGGGTANGTRSLALGSGVAAGEEATALRGNASALRSLAMHGSASAEDAVALQGSANAAQAITIGKRAASNGMTGSVVIAAGAGTTVKAQVAGQFVANATRFWFGNTALVTATANRFLETSTGAYLTTGGTWTNASDSTVKTAFRAVDDETMLTKIAALPVYTWQYRNEDSTVRHMGPTAQSFRAAFGLGDTDKAIATVDIDGVALAGVKALEQRTRKQLAEINRLRDENTRLAARLQALEATISQLVEAQARQADAANRQR